LIGVGFVNEVAAEADVVTAGEASTEMTDSRISPRRSGIMRVLLLLRSLLLRSPLIGMLFLGCSDSPWLAILE
jgi:hypothetical protein